jgi:hypothetical protein
VYIYFVVVTVYHTAAFDENPLSPLSAGGTVGNRSIVRIELAGNIPVFVCAADVNQVFHSVVCEIIWCS